MTQPPGISLSGWALCSAGSSLSLFLRVNFLAKRTSETDASRPLYRFQDKNASLTMTLYVEIDGLELYEPWLPSILCLLGLPDNVRNLRPP